MWSLYKKKWLNFKIFQNPTNPTLLNGSLHEFSYDIWNHSRVKFKEWSRNYWGVQTWKYWGAQTCSLDLRCSLICNIRNEGKRKREQRKDECILKIIMFKKERYKLFSTLRQSRCEDTNYDSFLNILNSHSLLFGSRFSKRNVLWKR